MVINNERDSIRFERKLLKFWAQSFLLGIPRVIVGFRTRAGVLQTVQEFKTLEMGRMVRGKVRLRFLWMLDWSSLTRYCLHRQPHAWDPTVCLSFASSALDFIRSAIVPAEPDFPPLPPSDAALEDEPTYPVFRIEFKPKGGLTVRRLSEEEIRDEVVADWARPGFSEEDRVGFLTRRFVEFVRGSRKPLV